MMRSLLIVLILVSFAGGAFAQPVQWSADDGGNDHYYYLNSQKANWDTAKKNADKYSWMNENGYLVTITSNEEQQWILETFGTHKMWLGATVVQVSTKPVVFEWRWLTGEPFDYTNWAVGYPRPVVNDNPRACLWSDDMWHDQEKTVLLPYIIEINDPTIPVEHSTWGSIKALYE